MLCFKETEFPCRTYSFRYYEILQIKTIFSFCSSRYTISLSAPTDNCYLSDKDYKILNYYTELEPDRDFDIYTMNNRQKCEHPMIKGQDQSGR